MYKIIAALSILIRNFCLPNPFELIGNIEIPFQGTVIAIPPIVINFMIEPILHAITFGVVSLYYTRHKNSPAWGSFLYLVFYCAHVGLLYLMAMMKFALWAVLAVLVAYMLCHMVINAVRHKLRFGV